MTPSSTLPTEASPSSSSSNPATDPATAPPSNGAFPPESAPRDTIKSSSSPSYFLDVDDIFATLSSLTVPPSSVSTSAASAGAATSRRSPVQVLYTFTSDPNETRLVTIGPPVTSSSSPLSSYRRSSSSSSSVVAVQKFGMEKLRQLPKADVTVRWSYLDDYVAMCNGKQRNLTELVYERKVKVTGNRDVMMLVGELMEMARAKKDEDASTVDTSTTTSKRRRPTSKKRSSYTSNFLRRSYSGVFRRVVRKKSTGTACDRGGSLADAPVASLADAPVASSSTEMINFRDCTRPYTLRHMTTPPTTTDRTMVTKSKEDQGEGTEEIVAQKCARSERQNMVRRLIALCLSLGVYYYVYCKGLFWMCGHLETPVVEQFLQQLQHLLDGNAGLARMVSTILVHPLTVMMVQYLLAIVVLYLCRRHWRAPQLSKKWGRTTGGATTTDGSSTGSVNNGGSEVQDDASPPSHQSPTTNGATTRTTASSLFGKTSRGGYSTRDPNSVVVSAPPPSTTVTSGPDVTPGDSNGADAIASSSSSSSSSRGASLTPPHRRRDSRSVNADMATAPVPPSADAITAAKEIQALVARSANGMVDVFALDRIIEDRVRARIREAESKTKDEGWSVKTGGAKMEVTA